MAEDAPPADEADTDTVSAFVQPSESSGEALGVSEAPAPESQHEPDAEQLAPPVLDDVLVTQADDATDEEPLLVPPDRPPTREVRRSSPQGSPGAAAQQSSAGAEEALLPGQPSEQAPPPASAAPPPPQGRTLTEETYVSDLPGDSRSTNDMSPHNDGGSLKSSVGAKSPLPTMRGAAGGLSASQRERVDGVNPNLSEASMEKFLQDAIVAKDSREHRDEDSPLPPPHDSHAAVPTRARETRAAEGAGLRVSIPEAGGSSQHSTGNPSNSSVVPRQVYWKPSLPEGSPEVAVGSPRSSEGLKSPNGNSSHKSFVGAVTSVQSLNLFARLPLGRFAADSILSLFSVADNAGIKSILIKDKSKYRRKNRRVKFKLDTTFKSVKKLATQQANQIGLGRFLLAKITHPRVIDNWQMARVVAFTYELFWWPARLALGVHAKHVMNNAWFYVDVVVDSFYLVDILIQMVEGIVKGEAAKKAAAAAYTGTASARKSEAAKAGGKDNKVSKSEKKDIKKLKKQEQKLRDANIKSVESKIQQIIPRAILIDVVACLSMYAGIVLIHYCEVPEMKYLAEMGDDTPAPFSEGSNAVLAQDLVYWVCTVPRLVRIAKLAAYFRQQEMAIQVDMRKVAVYKFLLLVSGCAHWAGCMFWFIARIYDFSSEAHRESWVAQVLILQGFDSFNGLRQVADNTPPVTMDSILQRYMLVMYKGLNCLCNLGYEGGVPKTLGEMILAMAVFTMQVLIQAYILGTLFHYLVKKDANVEAFRKRMQRLEEYSVQRMLPYNLKLKLKMYFEFQYYKKRADDIKIFRSLPGSLQVKVASYQYSEVVLRNRQLFRGCNGQFLNQVTVRLREVYLMPGETHLRRGDMSRDMGFVTHGSLECSKEGLVLKTVRADSDGPSVVGEVAFFMGISEPYSTAARLTGDVTLLVFHKTDYEELVENYPEQHDILVTNLLAHFELDKLGNDMATHRVGDEGDDDFLELKVAIQMALTKRNSDALSGMTYAASEGDVETVKHLLQRGLPVNSSDYDLRTTLHLAAAEGNVRVVELLVEEGADINVQDRWGHTPLQDAIAEKHFAIIDVLHGLKAKLLYKDPAGMLCQAASENNVDDLKMLLRNGIDPDIGDYDARTALHLAAAEGSLRVADALIEFGANINVVDRWGATPLQDAVYNNHELVAKLIRMNGGILKTDDPAGIFCLAASKGNIQMLRLLHENGIDRNAVDYDDRSALHLACADKQILSVNHLLYVCQADPNITDRWKGTPLEDAIASGCIEAAVLLVGAGGRLGELGDQSTLQAVSNGPQPDEVRNTVAGLERKVEQGFLYADMLDTDQFVNFTRKAVVKTLEKAIGLQDAVDKLEDFVKSADKAFTRVDTHLSKIVNTEHKLDTSKKALSRSNSLSDSPQRLNVTHSAMLSSAERDSKMRQLNKFMLQVNRVQSVMLELDKMLEFNSYDENDEDIPFEEQLNILITDLSLRVNTQQLARILEQTEDPRFPNFLSVTSLASSTTFRTLVQQNHRLQLDEDFEEDSGPVNAFVLKEAFSMIDEAFSIFDPNGNGLIELEELQEFWGIVKNTLSGGGTLQALFTSKGPENPDGSLNKLHFTQRYLRLVGVSDNGSDHEDDSDDDNNEAFQKDEDSDDSYSSEVLGELGYLDEASTLNKDGIMLDAVHEESDEEDAKGGGGFSKLFNKMKDEEVDYTQHEDYEDKKKALNRWFRTADADGSGQLSIHELHTMIQQTGHDIGEKLDMSKLLRILDTLDVDGDGKLSPSEFHHAFMPLSLEDINTLVDNLPEDEETLDADKLSSEAHWLVIPPNSLYLSRWKRVTELVLLWYFIEVPLHIAFRPELTYGVYYAIPNSVADFLMVVDICLNFLTAYKNQKSVLVHDLGKIRRHYLGTQFPLHFVVAFPVDYIIWGVFEGSGNITPSHTIALMRLFKLVRGIREMYNKTKGNASDTKADSLLSGVKRLMRLIFMMNHMLACVWWYIGSETFYLGRIYQDSQRWISYYEGFGCAPLVESGASGEFFLNPASDKTGILTCANLFEQYCVSHYWVFASLTTNGLIGPMTPRNPLEISFTCMVMCVSLTVYAYILGEISNLVMKQDEELVATRSSILQVEDFVKNRLLPTELKKEIEHYFHFLASSNSSKDDVDVFDMLSHTLQVDVAKYISRGLLDNVNLLRDCDATFLDSLSILLRETTILPDTYIFHVNDVSRELFFVSGGAVELTVEALVDGEETEHVEAVLSKGDIFGEVSFLFGMRQTSNARTPHNMTATLFNLQKVDYMQLAKLYPEEEEKVTKNTLQSWSTSRSSRSASSASSGSSASASSSGSKGSTSTVDSHALDDMVKVKKVLELAKQKKRNEKIVAMVDAAAKNEIKEVQRILASGDVEVDEGDYDKRTALHLAASEGHIELMGLLLDIHHADVNVQDRYGGTPMIDSVRHKKDTSAFLLRSHGAALKLDDPAGALCSAAAEGDVDEIKRLVENFVDINSADYDSRTALHLAASNGHMNVLEYLASDKDIKLDPEDRVKGTPLQDAINHGHAAVQRFLKDKGATVGTMDVAGRICGAAAENNVEELKTLHRNGVNLNVGDYDARTALHLAASNGCLEATSWLLQQESVDKSPVDRVLGTPLSDALRHNRTVCAIMLEEYGGLPKDHADLAVRIETMKQTREEDALHKHDDRMKELIEESTENKLMREADDLRQQLNDRMHDARSHASTFLNKLAGLLEFHNQQDTEAWGNNQAVASKELGKAAVKLCEQLKDVVHMLEGKQKDSKKKKALITGAKVLKVLKPSLSASLESCRRNMTSLTLTIAALVKHGEANDYYFDSVVRKGLDEHEHRKQHTNPLGGIALKQLSIQLGASIKPYN